MKNIIVILIFMFAFTANAQSSKSKNAKHNVEVAGNCEMCKKRIEKAAYSVSGVKSAVWHIDDQMLHLIVNEDKTSVADVKAAVAEAGHDTEGPKATESNYESLHGCCKYDRKE